MKYNIHVCNDTFIYKGLPKLQSQLSCEGEFLKSLKCYLVKYNFTSLNVAAMKSPCTRRPQTVTFCHQTIHI